MSYLTWKLTRLYPHLVRYWFTETLPWRIAMLLPRKVALFAFVRVYSVIGRCDPNYSEIYAEWQARGQAQR